jgi:hypothetical protein
MYPPLKLGHVPQRTPWDAENTRVPAQNAGWSTDAHSLDQPQPI